MSPSLANRAAPPRAVEDPRGDGSHDLVGRVLVGFGAGVVMAAAALGPVLNADLQFLTPTDMAVIGTVMVALGGWMLRQAGRL